jgi:hypothetical protein
MPNVALKPSTARQYVLSAEVEFDFTNIADTGVPVTAVKLPFGAQVVGGALIVDTVWTTTGAATLAVGDAASGTRYAASTNLKAAARTALTLTGYVSDGSDIVITPTLADTAAAAGKARLVVEYVIAGRAQEVQTN